MKVTNNLLTESTSIHWHGIFQHDTPFMDGAAFITQCPILPRQSFTYRFNAGQSGTYWYHAHISNQRNDGIYGMLILHAFIPNIPYFNVFIQEWNHRDAAALATEDPTSKSHPGPGNGYTLSPPYFTDDGNLLVLEQYESGLINGRGRWNNNRAPLTTFTVTPGLLYRFRVVNGGLHHSLKFEIDNHCFQIVALDGFEVSNILVDAFIVMPGERVDVIVITNQPTSSYWIRASTLVANVPVPQINAILRYVGSSAGDPVSLKKNCTVSGCSVFNCLFGSFATNQNITCLSVASAVPQISTDPSSTYQSDFGLKQANPDNEIFLNFGLANGPSVNGIRNTETPSFLYGQTSNSYTTPCNQSVCSTVGCECTNIISLPYNKVVQFVVTNYVAPNSPAPVAPHAFHMHGHSFAVLKVGYQPINNQTGEATGPNTDIACANDFCFTTKWSSKRPSLNLFNPSIKDTVVVPSFGYVVVRIKTTNPGLWFIHCHLESHMMQGMSLVMNEAENKQPNLPSNFPVCVDFE